MVNDPRYTVADPRYTISALHILPSHTFEYRAREHWKKQNFENTDSKDHDIQRILEENARPVESKPARMVLKLRVIKETSY